MRVPWLTAWCITGKERSFLGLQFLQNPCWNSRQGLLSLVPLFGSFPPFSGRKVSLPALWGIESHVELRRNARTYLQQIVRLIPRTIRSKLQSLHTGSAQLIALASHVERVGPLMTIGPLDDQRIIFDPVWSFLLTHLKIFKVSNPMLVDKWSGVRPALSPRSTNRSMSLGVGAKEVGNYVDLSHHQSATRDNPWCEP